MGRIVILVYGLVSYLIFLFALLFAVGFVGNWVVPKSIDGPATGSATTAALINVVLLSLFAIQHTIMARPAFKRWWTTIVPKPMERSTFVLLASLILLLVFWQWRPLPGVIWKIEFSPLVYLLNALSLVGWGMVVYSSFLIDHFDLFGLRQVVLHFQGKEYKHPVFMTRSLYKWIRHPLMAGFLIAFWSTPEMTASHLLFSAVTTGYIFFGIWIEERDLVKLLGEDYARYRRTTSMIIPLGKRTATAETSPPATR